MPDPALTIYEELRLIAAESVSLGRDRDRLEKALWSGYPWARACLDRLDTLERDSQERWRAQMHLLSDTPSTSIDGAFAKLRIVAERLGNNEMGIAEDILLLAIADIENLTRRLKYA